MAVLPLALFHVFSGTFSFCAAVSTEMEFTGDGDAADAEGADGFFCFFFLAALEAGGSALGGGAEELGAEGEGFLLPPFPVRREEMSNKLGTERNSCCVSPPPSSSETGGERLDAAFSPTFFLLREDEEVEEERSWGPEEEEGGGAGLEEGGAAGLAAGVWLDQADLEAESAAGLWGFILETSAGKSSS